MTVSTRTHVYVGFANPFLNCDDCYGKVRYWHNPERCGCDADSFNYPCEHQAGTNSRCNSWGPVDGCTCIPKHVK